MTPTDLRYITRTVLRKARIYGPVLDPEEVESIVVAAIGMAWSRYREQRGVLRTTFLVTCAWREYQRELRRTQLGRRIPAHQVFELDARLSDTPGLETHWIERVVDPQPGPAELAEGRELLRLVDWLPVNEREIVRRVVLERDSIAQAAKEVGVLGATADKRLRRGLLRLREWVEESERSAQGRWEGEGG